MEEREKERKKLKGRPLETGHVNGREQRALVKRGQRIDERRFIKEN